MACEMVSPGIGPRRTSTGVPPPTRKLLRAGAATVEAVPVCRAPACTLS